MPLDLNGVTLNGASGFAFNPVSLFAAGTQGAFYDPSDLNTLFQDAAGTTPVTAAGQQVGLMLDKSGRGNHATQSTSLNRPTLQTSGGVWYLDFDGSNDAMATASIDFSATDEMSVFAGVTKNSDAATGIAAELSIDATTASRNAGSFALLAPSVAGTNSYRLSAAGAGPTFPINAGTGVFAAAPDTSVITGAADISNDTITLRRNGSVVETSTSDQGTGNFGNYPLFIGARNQASLFFNGRLYSLIVLGRTATAGEITSTEQWVAGKTGITI